MLMDKDQIRTNLLLTTKIKKIGASGIGKISEVFLVAFYHVIKTHVSQDNYTARGDYGSSRFEFLVNC